MKRSHTIADLRSLFYQSFFVNGFPKYPEPELVSTLDRAFEMLPQREQTALSSNLSLQTQNESPWTCYDIFATHKPGLLSILPLTMHLPAPLDD